MRIPSRVRRYRNSGSLAGVGRFQEKRSAEFGRWRRQQRGHQSTAGALPLKNEPLTLMEVPPRSWKASREAPRETLEKGEQKLLGLLGGCPSVSVRLRAWVGSPSWCWPCGRLWRLVLSPSSVVGSCHLALSFLVLASGHCFFLVSKKGRRPENRFFQPGIPSRGSSGVWYWFKVCYGRGLGLWMDMVSIANVMGVGWASGWIWFSIAIPFWLGRLSFRPSSGSSSLVLYAGGPLQMWWIKHHTGLPLVKSTA